MALNIKDPETERLAAEVAALAGESKTRAVRVALAERRDRLHAWSGESELDRLLRFMQDEIWPQIPDSERGVVLTKADRDEILAFGPDGT